MAGSRMHRSSSVIIALLVMLVMLVAEPSAQHWPQWRGPAASGVSTETGLPVRWSDTENVAWKAPLSGLSVSSPVVFGDLVFVTSQRGSGVVRPGPRLVQSGNPLEAGERPLGSGPTKGDGNITFLVQAFDAATGRPRWEFPLPAEGPFASV